MAKIKLSKGGFTPIPVGTHVFKITSAEYDEDFGIADIQMVTADGGKHNERFFLMTQDGKPNEGAFNAFSSFARNALNDFTIEEIDPADLVGHFFQAKVTHDIQPNKNDPNKTVTWVRLNNWKPSEGFAEKGQAQKGSIDLDDLLG
ncbi:MAG TPA: hypothetical protein GX745_07915 [Clostridiales bacterium]|nr:hypothetical protein [Clostridiales bacterium]